MKSSFYQTDSCDDIINNFRHKKRNAPTQYKRRLNIISFVIVKFLPFFTLFFYKTETFAYETALLSCIFLQGAKCGFKLIGFQLIIFKFRVQGRFLLEYYQILKDILLAGGFALRKYRTSLECKPKI